MSGRVNMLVCLRALNSSNWRRRVVQVINAMMTITMTMTTTTIIMTYDNDNNYEDWRHWRWWLQLVALVICCPSWPKFSMTKIMTDDNDGKDDDNEDENNDDDSNRLRWSSVAQVGPSSGHTWSDRSAEWDHLWIPTKPWRTLLQNSTGCVLLSCSVLFRDHFEYQQMQRLL